MLKQQILKYMFHSCHDLLTQRDKYTQKPELCQHFKPSKKYATLYLFNEYIQSEDFEVSERNIFCLVYIGNCICWMHRKLIVKFICELYEQVLFMYFIRFAFDVICISQKYLQTFESGSWFTCCFNVE